MVTRKTSLPYPTSPPPPPPDFAPPRPNHDVDSSDLPPIPANAHRLEHDSPYSDMGNPWLEPGVKSTTSNADNLPESQELGASRLDGTARGQIPDLPEVLRPGWSSQHTPRSSLDSERSKDFWESSDDEEKEKVGGKDKGKGKAKDVDAPEIKSKSTEDLIIPPSLQIKRKPVANSPLQEAKPVFASSPPDTGFASNNPFRRSSSAANQQPPDHIQSWVQDADDKTRQAVDPMTEQLGKVILDNDAPPDYFGAGTNPDHNDYAQWQQQAPPMPQEPPPPIPIPRIISPTEQPSLIPVSPRAEDIANPWSSQNSISATPSPIPFTSSQKKTTYSTDDLLDLGKKGEGRLSLGDELKALPNAAQTSTSQVSLLDEEAPYQPPPGPPPPQSNEQRLGPDEFSPIHETQEPGRVSSPLPPVKPPRPAQVVKPLSDAELAQMQGQRNETYQIKHFAWYDHRSNKIRQSSMLTQNKNGPCPLLALVNALILGATQESQAALDDALRAREQVTLGLIIETLMDQLLSNGDYLDGELPDVDELNRFLIKLRTGMNMNPRFVQPKTPPPNLMDARNSMLHVPTSRPQDHPGGFEPTQDIKLYNAFGIKVVHGWLPEPGSSSVDAFERSAQNYEDAQVVQFGEEELDYKLSHGGLTAREQQLWQDIISIKTFFSTHPTQLSRYGLESIRTSMSPGAFSILFRNDHFSTIYKHPRDGQLYTLITDAGYADRDEIIWESLVDISGQQSEFFSGDFQSVSHDESQAIAARRQSNQLSSENLVPEPLSPQQQQEQHDADFAMALQLQEEEEQRLRQQRSGRPGSTDVGGGHGAGTATEAGTGGGRGRGGRREGGPRRSQGNIPIPLSGNHLSTENRPSIPPRNTRANAPAVNRPSDSLDADAPPSYEEAARGKPYNPPVGSPLHPQYSSTGQSPYNSVSDIDLPGASATTNDPPPPLIRRPERRQSAYNENLDRYNSRQSLGDSSGRMPGTYIHTGHGGHGVGVNSGGSGANVGGRSRNTDGDCTVM